MMNSINHARFQMVLQDHLCSIIKRLSNGSDLQEQVWAVSFSDRHFLDSSNVTFYSGKSVDHLFALLVFVSVLMVVFVFTHNDKPSFTSYYPPLGDRSRRVFIISSGHLADTLEKHVTSGGSSHVVVCIHGSTHQPDRHLVHPKSQRTFTSSPQPHQNARPTPASTVRESPRSTPAAGCCGSPPRADAFSANR